MKSKFDYGFLGRALILLAPLLILILILHFIRPSVHKKTVLMSLGKGFQSYEWQDWVLYTSREKEYSQRCLKDLDQFLKAFYREFEKPFSLKPFDGKIEIFIYRTFQDLQDARREMWRPDISPAAGFYDSEKRQIAVYDRPSYIDLRRVLYHEVVHMILDAHVLTYLPRWSLWFNEGLAGCFENTLFKKDSYQLGGMSPEDLIILHQMVQKNQLIPLRNLVEGGSEDFKTKGKASRYYAESAMLVYFLLFAKKKKHSQAFFKYFEIEKAPGKPSWFDFSNTFGDPEALEKEFFDWLKKLLL